MNFDITALTTSLQDIVNKLIAIKQQKPCQQHPLQEIAPPYVKQSMTYMSYLQQLLFALPPVEVVATKQSYSLQQDLLLLLGLSPYPNIVNRHFEEIAHKMGINRTSESLRGRYNDHLFKIGEAEIQKILKYLKQNGVKGYLSFTNNELHLTEDDPKRNYCKSTVKKTHFRYEIEEKDSVYTQISHKRDKGPQNLTQEGCQLNKIVRMYSKTVNFEPKEILKLLHQCSGDFVKLDKYIQNKDQRMLWVPEEDALLMKKGVELSLLIRYRGLDSINRRKAYLGLPHSTFPS